MAGGPIWTTDEHELLALARAHKVTPTVLHELWPHVFGYERGKPGIERRRKHPEVKKLWTELLEREGPLPPMPELPRKFSIEDQSNPEEEPTLEREMTWDPVAPEKRWAAAEKENDRLIEYHRKRHIARLEFQTNRPIAFAAISDQHISDGGPTNLRQMKRDALIVRDTPGLFALLGGDGVNNHIKHRSAMKGSGSKPGHEWAMYDHYLGLFGHKIAAMVSGNHDDWTKDETDLDMVGKLATKHRVFYAPDYVLLEVALVSDDGEQTYRFKMRHQYRYNSSFNLGHAVKRLWEMGESDFDVGILGHHHEHHVSDFMKHGLPRIAIRPGSYQFTSTYSRRYGYNGTHPSCPTVIVFPGTREMLPFPDVRYAASYLTWLRQGWPGTGEILAA